MLRVALQLALELGFPRGEPALRAYLSGESGALIDLLPELATLRDVAFYVAGIATQRLANPGLADLV